MLTLDAAKNLKAGQWIYSTTSLDSRGKPHRVKITSVKTWVTRPDQVRVRAKFGLYKHIEFNETHLDGWRL